jgi:hypothetical protein
MGFKIIFILMQVSQVFTKTLLKPGIGHIPHPN